jgi:anti-anti-sigma factor
MRFYLIVASGKHRGLPIPISVDLFVIGQTPTCQLRSQNPHVGEQHCAFVSRGRKVFVRDLGSGKPTLVNGSELPGSEEWPLHKGDRIAVGPLEFRISFSEKQLSQRDLEEWALKTLDEDHGPRRSAFEEIDEAISAAGREYNQAADAAAAILNKASALKGVVRGRLRIARDGSVTVVRINDVYLVEPAELAHLKKEFQENLNARNLRVLLDMKNVRRMSSAAVSLFADLSHWLRQQGGTLAVCRARPELAHLMGDLQTLFHLRVYADKEKALGAKW